MPSKRKPGSHTLTDSPSARDVLSVCVVHGHVLWETVFVYHGDYRHFEL